MKRGKILVRRLLEMLGYDLVRLPQRSPSGHVSWLFREWDVQSILDVGAHNGEAAIHFRDLGFEGTIISFEPVRVEFEELARRSAGDRKWRGLRLALGAESGTRTINVSDASQFSSFRRISSEATEHFPTSQTTRREEVAIQRLDDIWPTLGLDNSRVYLKLDTQGWDLEVLEGARRSLRNVVALQSEIPLTHLYEGAPGFADAMSYITGLGFAVTGIFPVTTDDLGRVVEIDCVFARPDQRIRAWSIG